MTTTVLSLLANVASIDALVVSFAVAINVIGLTVITLTAVYGRSSERRNAAHRTLAILSRHRTVQRSRRH